MYKKLFFHCGIEYHVLLVSVPTTRFLVLWHPYVYLCFFMRSLKLHIGGQSFTTTCYKLQCSCLSAHLLCTDRGCRAGTCVFPSVGRTSPCAGASPPPPRVSERRCRSWPQRHSSARVQACSLHQRVLRCEACWTRAARGVSSPCVWLWSEQPGALTCEPDRPAAAAEQESSGTPAASLQHTHTRC